jgi:hypothetical protein
VERTVEPEILDRLDWQDPEAIRSRADLVWINRLMGSQRWFLHQLDLIVAEVDTVIEVGAGEGRLLSAIQERFPHLRCLGSDLIPRPTHLDDRVEWVEGDLFQTLPSMPLGARTVVLADLVLHHFDSVQLNALRDAFRGLACILIVEPDRSTFSLSLGRCLLPFVGKVTRSDMMTSIRAGFRRGELAQCLGKQSSVEQVWLGGLRVKLV